MDGGHGLKIDKELEEALKRFACVSAVEVVPVVVVSDYLFSLAKGYGLSDSQHLPESQLGRADPPERMLPWISHYLGEEAVLGDSDYLRNLLYNTVVEMAGDQSVQKALNHNVPLSEVGVLIVAQVAWNLEATPDRNRLPLQPGELSGPNTPAISASIKVPNQQKDYATMAWTDRTNVGAEGLGTGQAYRSSGQGFRVKAARLAVLMAQRLIQDAGQPPELVESPSPDAKPTAPVSYRPASGGTRSKVPAFAAFHALHEQQRQAIDGVSLGSTAAAGAALRTSAEGRLVAQNVVVGRPGEVGRHYQQRGFDIEIEHIWFQGVDRRVWLRGGPGLGKTFSARRFWMDALASEQRPDLMIWVDSANVSSVTSSLSMAVDRMPWLGIVFDDDNPELVRLQAEALLESMTNSEWSWLVILDNANAASLIETGLIPTGANPNGRVLLTTLSNDSRISANGQIVVADLFTADQALAYIHSQIDVRHGGHSTLAAADEDECLQLARTVGFHPLALSIATATIVANHMEIDEWVTEFEDSEEIDAAADEPDIGGYPHTIATTWQIALQKASQNLPPGIVERAAAVSALLDPDGYPTWLWETESITNWVAKDSKLTKKHGRPQAIQKLIDHGILTLTGNNWKNGLLTIHQLAARSIRERLSMEDLPTLAENLVEELMESRLKYDNPELYFRHLTHLSESQLLPVQYNEVIFAEISATQLQMGLYAESISYFERVCKAVSEIDPEHPSLLMHAEQAGLPSGHYFRSHSMIVLHAKLARIYELVGFHNESLDNYCLAIDLIHDLLDDTSLDIKYQAQALKRLSSIHRAIEQDGEALLYLTQSSELYRLLIEDPTTDDNSLVALLETQIENFEELGLREETLDCKKRLLEAYRRLSESTGLDLPTRVDHLVSLGSLQTQLGQLENAKNTWSNISRMLEDLELNSEKYDHSSESLVIWLGLSYLYLEMYDKAAEAYSINVNRHSQGTYDPDSLCRNLLFLATSLKQAGRLEDAYQAHSRRIAILQRLVDAGYSNRRAELAEAYTYRGDLHFGGEDRWDEVEADYQHYELITSELVAEGYEEPDMAYASALYRLAHAKYHNNNLEEASAILQRAIDILEEQPQPIQNEHEETHADWLMELGDRLFALERHNEASKSYHHALDIYEHLASREPYKYSAIVETKAELIGHTFLEQSSWMEAESILSRVLSRLIERQDPVCPNCQFRIAYTAQSLALCQFKLDSLEQANETIDLAARTLSPLYRNDPETHKVFYRDTLVFSAIIKERLDLRDELHEVKSQVLELTQTHPDVFKQRLESVGHLSTDEASEPSS